MLASLERERERERESNLNYMTVLSLCSAVLSWSMRAGQSVMYTMIVEIFTYGLKFFGPVSLEVLYFQVKFPLNTSMKVYERFKDIALEF